MLLLCFLNFYVNLFFYILFTLKTGRRVLRYTLIVLCRKNIAIEKNKTDKLRIVNDSVAWTYKKGLLSHQGERDS